MKAMRGVDRDIIVFNTEEAKALLRALAHSLSIIEGAEGIDFVKYSLSELKDLEEGEEDNEIVVAKSCEAYKEERKKRGKKTS